MTLLHVYILLLTVVWGLYEPDSPVFKLTKENFKREVLDSQDLWFVEFFAPWCGHCKKLAPEYEKAARALSGKVRVGAVDMTVDGEAGAPYGVTGYPTVKFFGENKAKPIAYDGARTAKAIVGFGKKQFKKLAEQKTTGEATDTKVEEQVKSEEKKTEEPVKKEAKIEEAPKDTVQDKKTATETKVDDIDEGEEEMTEDERQQALLLAEEPDVVILTSDNFDELVTESEDMWFVDFFVPWCDHCRLMRTDWSRLAKSLRGVMKFGKIAGNLYNQWAIARGVDSYPKLIAYPPGDKSQNVTYEGTRDYDSMFKFINGELTKNGIPPKIWQVTSYESFNEQCGEKEARVCVMVFLPHIYDVTAAERRQHLDTIIKVATNHRSEPFAWLWAQAGDHHKLEQQFGIGFGYPAVLLVNRIKSKAAVMKSAFKEKDFDRFLTKMMHGRVALEQYSELADFGKTEEWDGKDHQQEMEPDQLVEEIKKAGSKKSDL